MKQTLTLLRKDHGPEEIDPLILEIDKELGEVEDHSELAKSEDEMSKKIKEMEAELALSDSEFEARLISRLKDEIKQSQTQLETQMRLEFTEREKTELTNVQFDINYLQS